nr:reverse transcriptase domain-containing protein [Tanacetum cinerariifolium]
MSCIFRVDSLRWRQVQQLQEELARVKVVNEEDEVHDDDSDGEEEYDNPFSSLSASDSGHSSHQHRRVRKSRHDFDYKVDIPKFGGKIQPNKFHDWLHTIEKVFDFKEVSEDRKVKLVAIKLQKYAGLWWENLKMRRVREEQTIARYLGGLRSEISNVVQLQPYWTYADVCKLVVKVKKQQKEKQESFTRSFNKEGSTSSGKTLVSPQRGWGLCVGGKDGLKMYSNRVQGREDIIEESALEVDVSHIEEVVYPDEGEALVIQRNLNMVQVADDECCSNVVATSMVEKLQLKIEDHIVLTVSTGSGKAMK